MDVAAQLAFTAMGFFVRDADSHLENAFTVNETEAYMKYCSTIRGN